MNRAVVTVGSGAVVGAVCLVVLRGMSLPRMTTIATIGGLTTAVAVYRRPTVASGLRVGSYVAGAVLIVGAALRLFAGAPAASDATGVVGRAAYWLSIVVFAVLGVVIAGLGRQLSTAVQLDG